MRHHHSTRAAFTLIELLIVLSVIGILAAILFPVLASARRRSQAGVCTSNLRQLGLGIAMYAADWDNGMPFAPDPLTKRAIGNTDSSSDSVLHLTAIIPYDLRDLLKPYGCETKLYRCPLDQNSLFFQEKGHKPTDFEECGSSYWYDADYALIGYKLDSYPSPATGVMMTDYGFYHLGPVEYNSLGSGACTDIYTEGTTNLLFADLHVKSHSWQDRTDFLDLTP